MAKVAINQGRYSQISYYRHESKVFTLLHDDLLALFQCFLFHDSASFSVRCFSEDAIEACTREQDRYDGACYHISHINCFTSLIRVITDTEYKKYCEQKAK